MQTGTSGQNKEYVLFSGTDSHNSIKSHSCAVLSGDGIALLLTPGTGISKPPMVSKRHDTDGRWRQVTKLPRPCPQYPPFTLRYGKILVLLKLAAHGDPGAATRRSQALRVAARAFEVILFDGAGQAGKRRTASLPYPPCARRQSSRPCLGRLLYSPAQQEKLEYWL